MEQYKGALRASFGHYNTMLSKYLALFCLILTAHALPQLKLGRTTLIGRDAGTHAEFFGGSYLLFFASDDAEPFAQVFHSLSHPSARSGFNLPSLRPR